jgi:hypothetical protein
VRRALRYRIMLHATNVRREKSVRHGIEESWEIEQEVWTFSLHCPQYFHLGRVSCSWLTVCFSTTTNKRSCHRLKTDHLSNILDLICILDRMQLLFLSQTWQIAPSTTLLNLIRRHFAIHA